MGRGLFLSALLHAAVVALAVAGLPELFDRAPPPMAAIAVELASMEEAPPPREIPPAPEPKRPPAPPPSVPAPPPPAPPSPPDPEPALEIPEPRPMKEPPPPAPPKPEPEAAPKPAPKPKPPPPRPKAKPKPAAKAAGPSRPPPKPRRKPKPPDERGQLQALLKNLSRDGERRAARPAPKPAAAAPRRAGSSLEEQARMARIVASVRKQLAPCWSIPVGAKGAEDMRVGIRIRLNPDGSLLDQPKLREAGRVKADRSFQTVAESALRALRDPACMPLELPFEDYDRWKVVNFNFDPKEALGQ